MNDDERVQSADDFNSAGKAAGVVAFTLGSLSLLLMMSFALGLIVALF